MIVKSRDEDPTFLSTDQEPRVKKYTDPDPDPTFNRNEEKNVFIF